MFLGWSIRKDLFLCRKQIIDLKGEKKSGSKEKVPD
jgi:hypothetical protein